MDWTGLSDIDGRPRRQNISLPRRGYGFDSRRSITTAVTAVVADRAVSKILKNFNQQTATAEKLQRLEMLLIKIHSTIEVSEKRAIKSAALIQWQDKLKEAASRGEEVLHSFQQREADVDEATGQNASDHQQQQEEGSSSSSVPATALSFKRKALSGMAQRVITIAIALFSSDEEVKKLNGAVEALEKESANIGEFIALLQLEASPNPKRRRSQMSSNNMEGLSFRLQEGDANTRFLHQHSAWRRRKNFVQQIEHNSQIATAPDEKAALAHNFFSEVGSVSHREFSVDLDYFEPRGQQLSDLEEPFTVDEVNKAFITLLPKRSDARKLKDFRPISLVHSFVKLFTKVLSRRLAPKLDALVAKNQSAFVKKRCIQDNFMLVRQSAKRLHDRRTPSALLKLDTAQAFDSISWQFILEVLEHKGFGLRWRSWIAMLFRTTSSRVLINGEPGCPILHRRGVRQGDPISPMIFILAMNVLSSIFSKAEVEGLLQPLGIPFCVSLYADDVVAFIRPAVDEIRTAMQILAIFGEVLPLSIFRLKKEDLQPLVDKIARRLPSWMSHLMTPIGRATMVNVVLSSIPVYLLMAINAPKWVIKGIDKICRGFLWAGKASANGGVCRVVWAQVCSPKEYGGLGIPDLERLEIALRLRWLWQQRTSPEKPRQGLNIPVSQKKRNLGSSIRSLALAVYAAVPARLRNHRTVAEAITDKRWIQDISSVLGTQAILEYFKLWDCLRSV
ncbi:Os03g0821633 [Oryza sativa Japonica Group]|uniref:Os03g0821633 protein n=1 Tax=Oryza sativa subsp. japonica TaxID=39947 RepID=C7IZJ2_ORYSJ|nr:Os03g0821633 [Oryza sativa Japonica Group]|eukprot:NP_001173690.1 Os03g0821633 [Oryza sativa Japonica Group]